MIPTAGATDGPGRSAGPGRRTWLRAGAALAGSAILLGVIVWKSDPARLARVLRTTRPVDVALALASAGASLALLALRWHWMLQLRNVADRYRDSLRTTLIGYGLTMVLPGAVVGDVAKSYRHSRRHGRPLSELLLASGLDRFIGVAGVAGYALLILGVAVPRSGGSLRWAPDAWSLAIPWKAATLALPVAVVLWVVSRRPQVRSAIRSGRRLVHDGWQSLRDRPRLLAVGVLLSVLGNVLVAATLAFGLSSVAPEPLPWSRLLWTLPVIGLAAAFPLTVAGAGAREGAAVALWAACGIPAPVAVAACLVTLAVNGTWAALGGLMLAGVPETFGRSRRVTSRGDAPGPTGRGPGSSGR